MFKRIDDKHAETSITSYIDSFCSHFKSKLRHTSYGSEIYDNRQGDGSIQVMKYDPLCSDHLLIYDVKSSDFIKQECFEQFNGYYIFELIHNNDPGEACVINSKFLKEKGWHYSVKDNDGGVRVIKEAIMHNPTKLKNWLQALL